MHIPDGFIPLYQSILYWIISFIYLILIFYKISNDKQFYKQLVLIGILTAATVVASSLSIPSPMGVSMHLFLIPLVVIILGFLKGSLVSFISLLFQAFFLGMGGVTTLGANFLVMGIVLSIVTYLVYNLFLDLNRTVAIFSSTLLGIISATFIQIIILLFTGTTSLNVLLVSLLPFYLIVGIIEGVLNIIILNFINRANPNILELGVLN